jgi:hypothetical protein
VAKWNKINYVNLKTIVERKMAREKQDHQTADDNKTQHGQTTSDGPVVEKYSILTILRSKTILIISLIMWFTWQVFSP